MRRVGIIALAVVLAAAALYLLVLRDKTVSPTVTVPRPVAAIGVGSGAVGVDSSGRVLSTMPAPEDGSLPLLPATEPPKSGRVEGPLLQQVRILAAAPAALRPYLANTSYGEQGVSVELSSGIEIRFGDATEAATEVARGGRGARRSDHGSGRLHRCAGTAKARRIRFRARSAARRINPRPKAQTGQTLK